MSSTRIIKQINRLSLEVIQRFEVDYDAVLCTLVNISIQDPERVEPLLDSIQEDSITILKKDIKSLQYSIDAIQQESDFTDPAPWTNMSEHYKLRSQFTELTTSLAEKQYELDTYEGDYVPPLLRKA